MRAPLLVVTVLATAAWYYLKRPLDPGARLEYAIAGESLEDSELRMPAYRDAPELAFDPSLPRGRIVEAEIESRIRGNRRTIFPAERRTD